MAKLKNIILIMILGLGIILASCSSTQENQPDTTQNVDTGSTDSGDLNASEQAEVEESIGDELIDPETEDDVEIGSLI